MRQRSSPGERAVAGHAATSRAFASTRSAGVPEQVAGYRVLRPLARDDRADVLLVHSGADREGPGAGMVAKVFASAVPRAEVDRELATLVRVAHPHVQALEDVGSLADGRVTALFPRCERGSLGDLLSRRDEIGAGEAITILAPLCDAVEAMHAAGVAHGRISVSRVLFTAAGAPVVIGFSRAVEFAPNAPEVARLRVAEVSADRDALAALADALLTRVAGQHRPHALAVLERTRSASSAERVSTMRDALFSLTAAAPVRFDRAPEVRLGSETMSFSSGRSPRRDAVRREAPTLRSGPTRFARAHLVELIDGPGPRQRLTRLAGRAWTALTPRRRRLVTAAATACAVVAIACVAIPPASPSASTSKSTGAVSRTLSGADSAAGSAVDSATGSKSGISAPPKTDAAAGAVMGTDPVAATTELLATRERCIRELSVSCLGAVDDADSTALSEDRGIIADIRAGRTPSAFVVASSVTPVLAQGLGGAALISLGAGATPASLLVTRSEAGWRIRDYAAAPSG